jgi:hypothetical protein
VRRAAPLRAVVQDEPSQAAEQDEPLQEVVQDEPWREAGLLAAAGPRQRAVRALSSPAQTNPRSPRVWRCQEEMPQSGRWADA